MEILQLWPLPYSKLAGEMLRLIEIFFSQVPLMIVMPGVKKESQSIVTSLQQA